MRYFKAVIVGIGLGMAGTFAVGNSAQAAWSFPCFQNAPAGQEATIDGPFSASGGQCEDTLDGKSHKSQQECVMYRFDAAQCAGLRNPQTYGKIIGCLWMVNDNRNTSPNFIKLHPSPDIGQYPSCQGYTFNQAFTKDFALEASFSISDTSPTGGQYSSKKIIGNPPLQTGTAPTGSTGSDQCQPACGLGERCEADSTTGVGKCVPLISAGQACDLSNPDSCAGLSQTCQPSPQDPKKGVCVQKSEASTNRDTGGLVPCTTNCGYCDLLTMIQRILIGKDHGKGGLLTEIVPAVGIFLVVIAGLMMLTSAGNEDRIKKANSMIVNVISGLALIYAAWLIVHGTLTLLVAKQSSVYDIVFPWYKIECNLSGSAPGAGTPNPPPAP